MKNQGIMVSGFLNHGAQLLWRKNMPTADHARGRPFELDERGSDHPLGCLASGVGNHENLQHRMLATLLKAKREQATLCVWAMSVTGGRT